MLAFEKVADVPSQHYAKGCCDLHWRRVYLINATSRDQATIRCGRPGCRRNVRPSAYSSSSWRRAEHYGRVRTAVRDVFTGQIGAVRLTHDRANWQVSWFVLDAGRIQNFHFVKRAK